MRRGAVVGICMHALTHVARVRACATVAVCMLIVMAIVTPPSASNRSLQLIQRSENKEYMDRVIELHQRQQVLEDTFDSRFENGRSIDLTIFVVFHSTLLPRLFDGLVWPQIAPIGPRGHAKAVGSDGKSLPISTAEGVQILANRECLNRTSVIFIATNEKHEKRYPPALVENRLLKEWEMPGYDEQHINHTMNEYGAMDAIFKSKITQNAGRFNANHSFADIVTADADGDGVQEWIGFFQYDMRMDSRLLTNIRGRIIQKTSAKSAIQMRNRHHTHRQLLCCVFFGVTFPTNSLLMNPLGHQLLREYNTFFAASRRLSELPAQSIIDAFVVPTVLFNHIMPFLDKVMHRAQLNIAAYPTNKVAAAGGGDSSGSAIAPPLALEVAEAALALALGFQSLDFIVVQMPLRHEKV